MDISITNKVLVLVGQIHTHALFLELLFIFNSLNVFAAIRYWPYMTDNSLMQLRYL